MSSHKERIQVYLDRGLTLEAAKEKVRRIENASASTARRLRQNVLARAVTNDALLRLLGGK